MQGVLEGHSLERVPLYVYGNDPACWTTSMARHGTPGSVRSDTVHLLLGGHTVPVENGGAVSWSTIPGERYRVEYREDLSGGSWVPLQTVVAEAAATTLVDETALSGLHARRFYRVRWLR